MILKHSRVTAHNLEFVLIIQFVTFLFLNVSHGTWLNTVLKTCILDCSLPTAFTERQKALVGTCGHWFRKADYHCSCVFDDIHSLGVEYRNKQKRVGTFQNSNSAGYGFEQCLSLVQKYSHVDCYYFSVGLGFLLNIVVLFELVFELEVIWNYSVMDNCDPLFMIKMRMRIQVRLIAVSCPPSVPNSQELVVLTLSCSKQALHAVPTKSVQRSKLSGFELFGLRINADDPARVIPAWLQNLQAIHAHWTSLFLVPNIADNSAALILYFLHLPLFVHVISESDRTYSALEY